MALPDVLKPLPAAGIVKLVSSQVKSIISNLFNSMAGETAYQQMSKTNSPCDDSSAYTRVLTILGNL